MRVKLKNRSIFRHHRIQIASLILFHFFFALLKHVKGKQQKTTLIVVDFVLMFKRKPKNVRGVFVRERLEQ